MEVVTGIVKKKMKISQSGHHGKLQMATAKYVRGGVREGASSASLTRSLGTLKFEE